MKSTLRFVAISTNVLLLTVVALSARFAGSDQPYDLHLAASYLVLIIAAPISALTFLLKYGK